MNGEELTSDFFFRLVFVIFRLSLVLSYVIRHFPDGFDLDLIHNRRFECNHATEEHATSIRIETPQCK